MSVLGIAMVAGGLYAIFRLRPRARARARRAVITTGTVVSWTVQRFGALAEAEAAMGEDSRNDPRERSFLPVVAWTGPDGEVRTQVPHGATPTVNPPAIDVPITLSHDPQDLSWVGVAGGDRTGETLLHAGALALLLGLGFMTMGLPSLLSTFFD